MMDEYYDDENGDSIYANDLTSELLNVQELLKNNSLDELLKIDRDNIREKEKEKQWYHGRIARDVAEDILKKGLVKHGNMDGLFLVRESSFSSSSFVLSLYSKGIFFHFQINEVKSAHFSIDQGPTVHGLDRLIQNYQEQAQGLPTHLTLFCKCKPPPDEQRYSGVTNLLHRAVLENIPEVVKQILASKYCPSVNAKSEWGMTALHDACYYGFEDVADLLIRNGANVNCFDKDGQTPLHRCCTGNKAGIISILIQEGNANVNERNPKSGWIPIHQAAYKGYLDCIKILLDYHSPYLPRADDDTTPLDLAENYEHADCVKEIEQFEQPKVITHKYDWFHPEIDRQGGQKLLELKGLREGLFLVRSSKKNPDWHVLTLCHDQKVFNYEIKTKNYRDRHMYFIDDGPFYKCLEHLIQYYSYHANGLPCALSVSVNTTRELVQISKDDEYFNLVDTAHRFPTNVSPALPPRPEDLDMTYSESDNPPVSNAAHHHAPLPPSPTPPTSSPPPPPNHPPPISKQHSITKKPEVELRQIDRKLLSLGKEIGQGEFGSVVKGHYKKKPTGRGKTEKIDVAIKLFHKTAINNQEDFLKEARTMQQLEHDCIVNFIGIAESDNHELMLVEEYIAMGSMLDYLIDHRENIKKTDLYLWAAQIAYGMMYLEQQKMVHRDLAARNILLQSKERAKISDFGLSRAVGSNSDYYKATTGGRWPIKWYAPECVNYGHFSHASDVWSFGVTLWEMFSYGEPPYGDMKGIEVIKFIEEGKRLAKPENCPEIAYTQMKKCWNNEPRDRPTFKALNTHFQSEDEYVSTRDFMKTIRK
ncbi:tyrosine-protein kinase HTK16-like [Mercenaria mercenaria]|uniref:tyrosine-protein kinase HTK16-like n=1 Tax=Mercenaria mercenaria TaxID=6596 RepID=UPI00234ECC2F|nr:tyrosine-protein kinase HTK16-like [Mercenaria mercenaria]